MHKIALILSLLIFYQSLSVCGPRVAMTAHKAIKTECKSDKPIKSCCTKKNHKPNDSKDKKGCCGENCKCLTCAKVFLNPIQYAQIKWVSDIEITKKVIYPVFVHSYDFYPSIAYPPNV